MILAALAVAVACVAVLNPVEMVAIRDLTSARDRLLLGATAALGIWAALEGALWLALLALWHVARWRSRDTLPSLMIWLLIAGLWALLRHVPPAAWPWVAWAWCAAAAWQVGVCVYRWIVTDWSPIKRKSLGRRSKGLLGSPVLTSFFFVLVAPFCPWWGWPVLALGLWLTCSITAAVALALALAVLHPTWTPWIAAALGLSAAAWIGSRQTRWRIFEWTPRGDSLDAWESRRRLTVLLLWHWLRAPWARFVWGFGPDATAESSRQWSSRQAIELPNGEAHNDPAQLAYEYGLVGAAAAMAFIAPIVPHLRLGDPWSAAWLALVAISFVHWPLRHPVLGVMGLVLSVRLLG